MPNLAPQHPYRALAPNLEGRDWFVGDIHGCFPRLETVLAGRGFDTQRDRLISVGDLVDRGENSEQALQWLQQPWFHAVRGNHEDLYLEWRALRHDPGAQTQFEDQVYFRKVNGGRWVRKLDEARHARLEQALAQLPYFLAVPHINGMLAGVVHAELPDGANWPSLINLPLVEDLRRSMTWGRWRWRGRRGRIQAPNDSNHIPGLDMLVCGHVQTREATSLGNIVYLDTGGWNQGHFTVATFEEILDLVGEDTIT